MAQSGEPKYRPADRRTAASQTTQRSQSGVDSQVFTGEYRHAVDDKGRLAVPSRFRAQLEAGLVVSRWLENCLAIHTRVSWDALAAKVATLPITDGGARRFERFIFAGAVETTLDGQGRVLIPGYLREMAGLAGEAVVVGTRDHAEIWAPDRWEPYRRSLEDPAALAEAIEGLGI